MPASRTSGSSLGRTRPAIVLLLAALLTAVLAACDEGDGGTVTAGPTSTTSSPAATATCATPGLPTTVAYRSIPGVATNLLSLDVHAPVGACGAPVVLWVQGGGYQAGDKRNQIADKAALIEAQGWILVSINYRLSSADPASARFPDHYEDVAAAIGWVHRTIATYGGDPRRIALLGHSAGADIVANVAAQPSYLAAEGLEPTDLGCVGPLDTEGFDKVAVGDSQAQAQWTLALGNEPTYRTATSATRLLATAADGSHPDTIGVYRGSAARQAIERAYLDAVAATGARTVLIDARSLSHEQVNDRIGASGDTVMTPPLLTFLRSCFRWAGPAPDAGAGRPVPERPRPQR